MSIQTELSRIINAKATIKSAIEGKGVTVPEATLLDGMAALIDSIEAGGGVRIEHGSVTFAEEQSKYRFVTDSPDIFIAYVEDDSNPQYSSSKYIWVIIQDARLYSVNSKTGYFFAYSKGTMRYYVPYRTGVVNIGEFSAEFNGVLGTKTYKWYAIYGVTAT